MTTVTTYAEMKKEDIIARCHARLHTSDAMSLVWERAFDKVEKEMLEVANLGYREALPLQQMRKMYPSFSADRAAIEIGFRLGELQEQTYSWLCRSLGEPAMGSRRPSYDAVLGTLTIGVHSIKFGKGSLNDQILDAFEKNEWCREIATPDLSNETEREPRSILSDLQKRLKKTALRICSSEKGRNLYWKLIPTSTD